MSGGVDNPVFENGGHDDNLSSSKENGNHPTKETSQDDDHVTVKPSNQKAGKSNVKKGGAYRYGCGSFKPSCLQFMNKVWLFVVWAFILCFIEGFAVNGIANAGLPSIEKQFQLSSTKSALIPSSQDIGALCVVLFVSYLGGMYHKPRWVAAGSVIMGVGSVLFMVPHFVEKYVFPDSTPALTATGVCNGTSGGGSPASATCETEGEKYLPVFVLAQMIHGFGFTPMFTLGTVYIDENEDHTLAAVYIGLTYAAAAIGVAAGFFAGGQIIQNIFVDFDRVSVDFTAQDSRWIGAWWLGFIFTAVGFFLVAIPIFAYPKSMKGDDGQSDDQNVENEKTKKGVCKLITELLKRFIKSFLKLLTNPIYMSLNIAGCAQTLIISGVGAFSFKFLSEQYNLNFDIAGNLIGGLILTGSFGMFFGGLLVRIFRLEVIGMTRLNSLCTLLSALLGISFLAGCPEVPLAGLEVPYTNSSSVTGYSDVCHSDCRCDSQPYSAVCGSDNKVYYSPCHAGCSSSEGFGPMAKYSNCSCIAGIGTTSNSEATAVAGRCSDDCTNITILAPCLFLALVCVLTAATPSSMATLRCVDEEFKPFALGIQWMFFRLLGTIPGPVLVGWVIDQSCLLWQGGTCGSQGACLLYSHDKLSVGVMTWWVVVTLVASLFFFIASLFALRNSKGVTLSH